MGNRTPGPVCQATNPLDIDDGTMVRCESFPPTPTKRKVSLTPGGFARMHSGMERDFYIKLHQAEHEIIVLTVEEFVQLSEAHAASNLTLGVYPGPLDGYKLTKHLVHAVIDLKLLMKPIREMGFKAKARFAKVNGVDSVVLSGLKGLREILKPKNTHFKIHNPKVVELVIGKAGIMHNAMHALKIGVVLSAAVNVVKYGKAYRDGEMGLAEALISVLKSEAIDLAKVGISTVAGTLAGILLTATGLAVLPFAGAVLVGLVVGYGLDYFFPTKQLVKMMENQFDKAFAALKDLWIGKQKYQSHPAFATSPFYSNSQLGQPVRMEEFVKDLLCSRNSASEG